MRNISIVMRNGTDETKERQVARGTPANTGAADIIAQRAASATARPAHPHSWMDGAESASA